MSEKANSGDLVEVCAYDRLGNEWSYGPMMRFQAETLTCSLATARPEIVRVEVRSDVVVRTAA